MRNPFNREDKITLTASDVINLLGAKEAQLMLLRGQLQQAAQMIEQFKAQRAEQAPLPPSAPPSASDAVK